MATSMTLLQNLCIMPPRWKRVAFENLNSCIKTAITSSSIPNLVTNNSVNRKVAAASQAENHVRRATAVVAVVAVTATAIVIVIAIAVVAAAPPLIVAVVLPLIVTVTATVVTAP